MLSDVTYSGAFDKNNYLWICTDRGLSRFDGTRFTHFTINEGLPDNDIIYVTVDDDGTIWAQPFQREAAFLEQDKSVFVNINTIIPADTVREDVSYRVFNLRDGKVGLISRKGVIRIIYKRKWIDSYRLPLLTNAWGFFIYENKKHELVFIRRGDTFTLSKDKRISIAENNFNFGRVEVCKGKGIMQLDGSNVLTLFDPSNEQVRKIDPLTKVHRFGLLNNGILTGDPDRNLSFTDFHTGKTEADPLKALMSYATENSDGSVQVIFTADQGIFIRTREHDHKYTFLNKSPYYFYLNSGKVKAADGFNKIIFPEGSQEKVENADIIPTIPVFAERIGNTVFIYGSQIIISKAGKAPKEIRHMGGIKDVYIANDSIRYIASHEGIFDFNIRRLTFRKLYEGRTTCVSAGPNGSVFIGTHWGLLERKKDGTVVSLTKAKRFPDIRVIDIIYRNGVVWIATAGKGLIAICGDRITTVLTSKNGISRNVITAIEADSRDNLFIGYHDGAQKISYSIYNNFPVVEKLVTLKTSKGEGIKAFSYSNGKMYALGNRGVFRYDTGAEEIVKEFDIRITRVIINNKLREVAPNYNLQPGDYDFQLAFSTINFEQFPLRYRYRINNSHWNYTSDNEIRYKNLSWGTYKIDVQVLNNYCLPSDTKTITFDVSPPFFRRTGFLAAAGAALILLIFVLSRFWFRRKYRKAHESLLHEKKLNELELVALKAQINPHFVFNCLNSIKGLIYENALEEADKYIDRFAELFRNTLEASSSVAHPVSTEIAYLRTYLEMEQVSMKGRFDFAIEIHSPLDGDSACIPPMLVQPYVENAIKHGVSRLMDRRGEIKVRFEQQDGKLICTITDNGIGRAKNTSKTREHSGKGIAITTKRAQLYQMDTQISDNIPSGTIVRIVAPLNLINETEDDKSNNH